MPHAEDVSARAWSARMFHALYETAFDKAHELLKARLPETVDSEIRERYMAFLPMLAVDMSHYMLGECNMHANSTSKDIASHLESVQETLTAIRAVKFSIPKKPDDQA